MSLGTLGPAEDLGDPFLYLHPEHEGVAEKMDSILAWVGIGAPKGAWRGPGGHTKVALPAQGEVRTAGL